MSSLAVAGCSPSARPANVAVIEPIDAAVPSAIATAAEPLRDAGPPDAPRRGKWLTIPDGITAETRLRYERLDERVAALREAAQRHETEMGEAPKCPGFACDDFWREMMGKLDAFSHSVAFMTGHCPEKREETDRFLEAASKQRAQMEGLRDALHQHAEKILGSAAKLQQYQRAYDMANPRPCLSIACDRW